MTRVQSTRSGSKFAPFCINQSRGPQNQRGGVGRGGHTRGCAASCLGWFSFINYVSEIKMFRSLQVSASLPHTSVSGVNKEINKIRKEMGVFFPAGNFLGWCLNSPPKESSSIFGGIHSSGMRSAAVPGSLSWYPGMLTGPQNPKILAASQHSGTLPTTIPGCSLWPFRDAPRSHPIPLQGVHPAAVH